MLEISWRSLCRSAVLAAALVFPMGANAATVARDGSAIRYTAGDEVNHAGIANGGDGLYLYEMSRPGGQQNVPLNAGPGCTQVSPSTVTCPAPAGTTVSVDLGGGNDELIVIGDVTVPVTAMGAVGNDMLRTGAGPDVLDGGEGDDELIGFDGDDVLGGGAGDDLLEAMGGNDRLEGEDGADKLQGGGGDDVELGGPGEDRFETFADSGADDLQGGEGRDTVSFNLHSPATASLDGRANDGNDTDDSHGRRDDIDSDVEVLEGGGGADRLTGGAGDDELRGGQGDDVLDGAGGDDLLVGGWDADTLKGGAGFDWVSYDDGSHTAGYPVIVDGDGQTGDDGMPTEHDSVATDVEGLEGTAGNDRLTGNGADNVLDGGRGDDLMVGAGGEDVADYSYRSGPLDIDLGDGRAEDGERGAGERDSLDVEDVWGGFADDHLRGDARANVLDGGGGDDVVDGAGGPDLLIGGGGWDAASYASRTVGVRADPDGEPSDDGEPGEADTIDTDVEDLYGGAGDDRLTGSDEDNLLLGGAGADVLSAGIGDDALDGQDGRDSLDAGDGADVLELRDDAVDSAQCGAGADQAAADAGDVLAADCEIVQREAPPRAPAPPPPPPPPPAPDRTPPTTAVAIARRAALASVRSRGIKTTITCSEACRARVVLTIGRRTARRLHLPVHNSVASVGHGQTHLDAGRPGVVRVRLSHLALRALRHSKATRIRVVVSVTDTAGNATTVSRTLTLRT